MVTLDRQRLVDLLHHDPATGAFTWKVSPSNRVKFDAVAGTIKDRSGEEHQYLRISIDGRLYLAHRLVWLYVHDEWPPPSVDHINGVGTDNRLCNLRACTQGQNSGNHRRLTRRKKSGYRGVRWRNDCACWSAQIKVDGRSRHLCIFIRHELNADRPRTVRPSAATASG